MNICEKNLNIQNILKFKFEISDLFFHLCFRMIIFY